MPAKLLPLTISQKKNASNVESDPQINIFDTDRLAAALETPVRPTVTEVPQPVRPVTSVRVPVPPVQEAPAPLPAPAPAPVPARKPVEPAKIVFDLESQHEVFTPDAEPAEVFQNASAEEDQNDLQQKSVDRRERLRRLSSEITNEAIKEKLEVPAYLRRNVALENVPHSSNRNIPREQLNYAKELVS